jgi:hypothetical protein
MIKTIVSSCVKLIGLINDLLCLFHAVDPMTIADFVEKITVEVLMVPFCGIWNLSSLNECVLLRPLPLKEDGILHITQIDLCLCHLVAFPLWMN